MARKGTPITFYASDRLLVAIEAACQALGLDRSALLRLAATQFLINEGYYNGKEKDERRSKKSPGQG